MNTDPNSGLRKHESALGRWERAWHRPSAPLRGLVAGYHGYRQRLTVPAVHRGIPSATLPLVISFGPNQTITPAFGPARRDVTVSSFVAGLHDAPVLIQASEFHGIQIDLRPVAGTRLLGAPIGEFTGRTVPLEAVFGGQAEQLVDDLACAPNWPSRFLRVDEELMRLHSSGAPPDPEILHVWDRITTSRGSVSVETLATEIGWSRRRLRKRAKEQLGLLPKRLARLTRFEHAAQLLAQNEKPDLAAIALTTGYYDQAHLSNEVRAFSGLTPTQLISGHLPDHGGVFDLEPGDHARAVSSKTPVPSRSQTGTTR